MLFCCAMSVYRKRAYADWMLGGLLFLVCVVLTLLQYRWTGRLARAEVSRRNANLQDQTQAMARAFDADLEQNCIMLLPDAEDLNSGDLKEALLDRFREWKAARRSPLFAHIALGLPTDDKGPQLFELDQRAETLRTIEWPFAWSALQDNLHRRHTVGSPPFFDPAGTLVEFPVFGGFRPRKGELGWVVVELDSDYISNVWLPKLVQKYLALDGKPVNGVLVRTASQPSRVLYALTDSRERPRTAVVSVRFNNLGKTPGNLRGRMEGGHWTVEAWQRSGALEYLVSVARWRNFAVAVLLNVLILVTGVMLALHTRRWRQLAETQMRFVATVSHELRTPLTVIRGAAHNLKRGIVNSPGQIEQYSQLIIEHADGLTEMVEQVLALAAARKHLPAVPRQQLAPADVLEEAIAATAHETKHARCSVYVELPPGLPPVLGDATALRRAFQNLITNAAKHGGDRGWIGIIGASDQNSVPPMVEIQVADHGRGIPADEQAEIFQPFFRGATAQAHQKRGSGLGLSLVREIVEAHGGTVSVHSARGSGRTFTVRLPVTSTARIQ